MSDVIRNTYTIHLDVNPDVWMLNYGNDPELVGEDIEMMMREVLAEQMNQWFIRTGNRGMATVVKKKK